MARRALGCHQIVGLSLHTAVHTFPFIVLDFFGSCYDRIETM